jgi:hypothetical protein
MLKELDESAAKILNLIITHSISIAIYISLFISLVIITGLSPPIQTSPKELHQPTLFDIPSYKDISDIVSKFWSDIRS